MFYLWLIPLIIVLAVVVWFVFFRLQHRVHGAERKEGRVLKSDE
jgi:cytochrome c-type biogenesis protein CcmH/NrfF